VPSAIGSIVDSTENIYCIQLAADGMIVIAPDYIGWGESDVPHAYMNAQEEGNAVVDMMRATKQLCVQLKQSVKQEFYLTGYSQGAHACMATARIIAEKYPTELPIKGILVGSGPYDMSTSCFNLMLNPKSAQFWMAGNNIALIIASTQHTIGGVYLTPTDIFKAPYGYLYLHCADSLKAEMKDFLGKNWLNIFQDKCWNQIVQDKTHPIHQFLKKNDVYDWKNPYSTRMYFIKTDEEVAYQSSIKAESTQRNYLPTRKQKKQIRAIHDKVGQALCAISPKRHNAYSYFYMKQARRQIRQWEKS
jgi:hypothetical protein